MVIKHELTLSIQTTSSNCVQTSTSQFLEFYDIQISPSDIEKEIPVKTDSNNKPVGTLFADIGAWLIKSQNLKVTMHVFDAQIIDRSWKDSSQTQLLTNLEELKETDISTALTPYKSIIIDAYIKYMHLGGVINIDKCTNKLLRSLLEKGPVMAIINFNYMYDYPRSKYDMSKKEYVPDSSNGKVIEHAIVLTGFEDDSYFYNDPDYEMGGQHTVKEDVLIGAICAAQLNSDNYILSIEV